MLNLMRADFYRTGHRLYYFLMIFIPLGIIFALLLITSVAVKPSPFQSGDGRDILNILIALYPPLGSWGSLLIADIAFSDEHRYDTLKNTIAYGYTRPQIYLSKLLTGLGLAASAVLLLLAGAYGLIWAFIGGSWKELMEAVVLTFRQLLGALPLWMGFLSLGLAVLFNIKNQWAAGITFAAMLILPQNLLALLGHWFSACGVIAQFLPSALLSNVGALCLEAGDLVLYWGIGIAFTVLTSGVGLALFSRREIK